MKKALFTLGLAGMCLTGNSQQPVNLDGLFQNVLMEKQFNINQYRKYIVNSLRLPKDGKTYIAFDFNRNGKIDVMATANSFLDNYASSVGFDKEEDGEYDMILEDSNGDNYLDKIIIPK